MIRLARAWPALFLLTGLGLLASAPSAPAAFRLQIMEGSTVVTDQTSAGPAITFSGSSPSYNLVLETGSTNRPGDPVLGGSLTSTLDVRRTATGGQATLTILLTATDYLNPPGSPLILNSTAGGSFLNTTAGDTVTFQSFADPANAEFATTVTTGPQLATAVQGQAGVSQPAVFNPADPTVQFARSGPYSITHRIIITLSANGQFAGGETTGTRAIPSQVVPAPEGLLLALTALPLLSGGWLFRRWRKLRGS